MAMEVITDCGQPITDAANNNTKSMDCAQANKSQTLRSTTAPPPLCVGCNRPILDQYVMKVQPDLDWHISCLKCVECHRLLDENCTCYFRDGKTYCKSDYHRIFLTPCSKCGSLFTSSDLVMRAENTVYHIECFSCTACSRRLLPGDEFALREGGLFCREDNEVLDRNQLLENDDDNLISIHNNNNNHHKLHPQDKHQSSLHHDSVCSSKNIKRKDGKPTRVRTVLSEKQLHTLRTCYQANPRPDALMKEQLVEMTGLSPRVIRVWFQNKRCKDKKKTILLKHLQQQEKMPGPLQGVGMVAQSPLRHDNGLKSIESYHHQNWKQIPDYGSHQDEINHNFPSSLIGSLYGSDDSAVYIGEDEYMDCIQPDSVSSQFSGASTSPHSST